MGNASWELICMEHGISPNGLMQDSEYCTDTSFKTFYSETGHMKFVPRTIFVDLESSVIGM